MKVFVCLVLFVAFASAWKIAPPEGKTSARVARANSTSHSEAIVNTLQATAEYATEAHNGVGWTSLYIAPGLNNFCSLTYTQTWSQTGSGSQTGCMVFYNGQSNQYFLQAFSGVLGSSSWCKARCIKWS